MSLSVPYRMRPASKLTQVFEGRLKAERALYNLNAKRAIGPAEVLGSDATNRAPVLP